MGGTASPPMRRLGEAVEVTELELRIQLLGVSGGGGSGGMCYNINNNIGRDPRAPGRALASRSHLRLPPLGRLGASRRHLGGALPPRRQPGAAGRGSGCSPATRTVVAALGGYRCFYRLCLGPTLDRLGRAGPLPTARDEPCQPLPSSSSFAVS
ncbi:hypothetical protein SEVIR_1G273101v4 [Setaria viridis]